MDIHQSSQDVITRIYNEEYYVIIFESLLQKFNWTKEAFADSATSPSDIITFWNDFWFLLPDSPVIHCPLFYDICDIAEHIFDD